MIEASYPELDDLLIMIGEVGGHLAEIEGEGSSSHSL